MGARNVLLNGRRLQIAGGHASGWRVAQTPRTAYRRAGEAAERSRGLAKTGPGVAAIRIPERMSAQLTPTLPFATPQLFVHEGARQALERRLMSAFPGIVTLSITDNRHSIISHSCKNGVLRARVHHMFLDAPPRVVRALVRYVTQGDRDASTYVGDYIEQNGARLARRRRGVALLAKGKHHDLLPIFNELNEKYFGGAVNALITWGKRGSRSGPRRTIKLGSYSALDRLIRIHPALDRPWVPRYFVSFIMYHEMLHHVIPASRGAGRRMLHPPEFRDREAEFRHFERAIAWEKQHIGRLLRSR
jgi:hypothetical protein